MLMPIAKGLAGTPIPRPERFYFSFGKPIDTTQFKGKSEDIAALWHLRDLTARQIEGQIGQLLTIREQDTQKSFLRRLLAR